MSTSAKIIIAVLGVAIIAGGAWLLMNTNKTEAPTDTTTENQSQQTEQPPVSEEPESAESVAATITYTADGFSPATTSVKSGSKIKIVNQTNEVIEFASNDHPVHTDNSELNAGDIAPGGETVITVTATGTWGFHNHYDSAKQGTLTVE